MKLSKILILSVLFVGIFSSLLYTETKRLIQQPIISCQKNQFLNLYSKNSSINSQAMQSINFRTKISYLISSIKQLKTPQGKQLTNQLTNDLFALFNLLQQQQHFRVEIRAKMMKMPLQITIKKLLQTIQKIEKYIQCYDAKQTSNKQTSIIKGSDNILLGQKNVIQGNQNKIKGQMNIAKGNQNMLVGNQSLIEGDRNSILGNSTFVIGNNNIARGNNSFIFSFDSKIDKNNSLVIGKYNVDISNYTNKQ